MAEFTVHIPVGGRAAKRKPVAAPRQPRSAVRVPAAPAEDAPSRICCCVDETYVDGDLYADNCEAAGGICVQPWTSHCEAEFAKLTILDE